MKADILTFGELQPGDVFRNRVRWSDGQTTEWSKERYKMIDPSLYGPGQCLLVADEDGDEDPFDQLNYETYFSRDSKSNQFLLIHRPKKAAKKKSVRPKFAEVVLVEAVTFKVYKDKVVCPDGEEFSFAAIKGLLSKLVKAQKSLDLL